MGLLNKIFGGAPGATVDVAEARRRQQGGAVLVDVREPAEWRGGHAPGATHIPLGALAQRADRLPRDRDVLLVCRSGSRSEAAQRILRDRGFERAFNVTGGMTSWERAGLPVER